MKSGSSIPQIHPSPPSKRSSTRFTGTAPPAASAPCSPPPLPWRSWSLPSRRSRDSIASSHAPPPSTARPSKPSSHSGLHRSRHPGFHRLSPPHRLQRQSGPRRQLPSRKSRRSNRRRRLRGPLRLRRQSKSLERQSRSLDHRSPSLEHPRPLLGHPRPSLLLRRGAQRP
jgi:hypothetical protein